MILSVAMARPFRFDAKGGWYHVGSRGIERKAIFLGDEDREDSIERLSELPIRLAVFKAVERFSKRVAKVEQAEKILDRALRMLSLERLP